MVGRRVGNQNASYVTQEGTCFNVSPDLQAHVVCEKHEKAVTSDRSSAKVISFFTQSGRKSDDVLAAEGAYTFRTVKYRSR
jgi:hypothetical protein